jgi:uncharacterized protein Veg
MPPIGEKFTPQTALTPEQQALVAFIEARSHELGTVLEALAPQGKRTWRSNNGHVVNSAKATYSHPELPDGQLMTAWVERIIWMDESRRDDITLIARPIDTLTGKEVTLRANDTKARVDENGNLINTYAYSHFTYEQQLEGFEEVAQTLQLIAEAASIIE